MKLTKKLSQERGLFNSFRICEAGGGKVFIGYRPNDYQSRCYSAWRVHGIGFNTDPQAHWMDYGSKTFDLFGGSRAEKLEEAKQWASQKYGIEEWVRDPFGGWQDKRAYEQVVALLRQGPGEGV